jgi:hypothetical protein
MLTRLRTYTRAQRRKVFSGFLGDVSAPVKILDLGGTVKFWMDWGIADQPLLEVTLVNNHTIDHAHADDEITVPNIKRMNQDVLELTSQQLAPYDMIFSNSMIEHLPGADAQKALASVILGSRLPYFVQTPNKNAPVDPHFPKALPFFAAYPRPVKARLWSWSGLGSGWRATDFDTALASLNKYYHPLSKADLGKLFPGAKILVERPLGVPMSIIATSHPAFRDRV